MSDLGQRVCDQEEMRPKANVAIARKLHGDVRGRDVLIVDDMEQVHCWVGEKEFHQIPRCNSFLMRPETSGTSDVAKQLRLPHRSPGRSSGTRHPQHQRMQV